MLKNYFKTGWRNIRRNRAFTLINVGGLSLGIACAIIVYTIISFNLSYDNFHHDKDRIYRIVLEWDDQTVDYSAAVPTPLGKAFRNDFTFAEQTTRVVSYHLTLVSLPQDRDARKFEEEGKIAYAEPAFFDIFNYPMESGNAKQALSTPNSAVITRSIATKYFGNDAAIGQTIRIGNKTDFIVKGILKDLPANTDRREEIYLSYDNLKDRNKWLGSDSSWGAVYSGSQCFVRLRPGVDPNQVNKALQLVSKKYYSGREANIWRYKLQPLADIHFNETYDGSFDKKYAWILGLIGLFLITTACVNFVNLATALALNRSREVGIRKVLGGLRTQLFWQFIVETALITTFATILGLIFAKLALPAVNKLMSSQMSIHLFGDWQLLTFILLLGILVVFLAGAYPGLVLARFQPILALRNKLSQAHIGGFSLRRILVVTQFAICQLLIIGTIVIAAQMRFSSNIDLGFQKEAIVSLPIPDDDKTLMNTLRERLAALPGVEKVTLCHQPPASNSNDNTSVRFDNRAEDEHWNINLKSADDQYLSTFGLQLAAGRNIYPSDTAREYIVNETFVKKLGLSSPSQVLGKMIHVNGGQDSGPIVGVVRDFHNASLHNEISAVCIMAGYRQYQTASMKINMAASRQVLSASEKIWNGLYPKYVYSYHFLDDRLREFYEMDKMMLMMVEIFAGIAIIIGCLGLYGLVSFMAVRKTKEIGVRKVLGASVGHILWLFGGEFARLLFIAFLIAAPLGWWIMHRYLESFKFRVGLGPEIFLLAIVLTFVIATLTVGYRSLRSALANPVNALRSE